MAIPEGWELVCGLEVHCELQTETKLFCGCKNAFGDEPNTNVCPVCLGLPGSLPVINERAVEFAMRIGAALDCDIRPSIFHRKNYFYPDMPKDYQVTQYDEPINGVGWLDLPDGTRIGVTRAHMEEDTGKNTHIGTSGRIHGADHSLVDYNRAGVPLVEIVSEPDIRSAEQAKAYVSELRAILVATGVSDGKMEEGSLRVDANVSVRRPDAPFGTRCEIKNVNSLRSLVRAIDYEANRQIEAIGAGERIVQETRHWNEDGGRTSSMRSKEEAMDYRYFPEPDLVPMVPTQAAIDAARASLPLLPAQRRQGLADATGGQLGAGADPIVTIVNQGLDRLVLAAIAAGADPRRAINRAANDVAAAPVGTATGVGAAHNPTVSTVPNTYAYAGTATAVGAAHNPTITTSTRLTATQAKQVLAELLEFGGDPATIAAARGFQAMAGAELEVVADELIAAHAAEFERLKAGDTKVIGFFVGQAMNRTGGKADGKALTALLRRRAGL